MAGKSGKPSFAWATRGDILGADLRDFIPAKILSLLAQRR
jgi:hypothetical protein